MMFSYRTWLITGAGFFAIAAAITAVIGAIWYHQDRPGMLQSLCKSGLPNFSRPAVVAAHDLSCNVLGPKRRVKGILLTGFEASSFITEELGPPPAGGGFSGSTWFSCNQVGGCDPRVDAELERSRKLACGTGLATIVVEGWPTVTSDHYGHLGSYSREFFADRVVAVGPPPDWFVRKWRKRLGFSDKDCQEMARSWL
jgi:hypothetical protein